MPNGVQPVGRRTNMKARTRVIGAALLLALAVAGTGWFLRPWLFPPGLPEGILEGFGRIEGTEVTVSSKLTGRILKLPLSEGDRVGTGDLVAQLSADEITARLGQARSRVASAEAQARMREEEAGAQIAEADARLRATEDRISQALARVEVLAHHAEKMRLDYRRDQELFAKGFISPRQASLSENALKLAEGELQEARAALAASRAEMDSVRAIRDGIARKTPALLKSLREEAAAATAAKKEIEILLADTRITAPLSGTVVTKVAEPGELVFPGTPLVVLVDLDRPYLRVYLPERDIGKVKLGDPARVFVDSFPGRPFEAVVTEVAKKAEFTPKDVHMPDERVTLVYSVKLEIRNPQGLLKPGMPADALIRWKPGAAWEK